MKTQAKPKVKRPYDPGQPAGIHRLSFREGTFLVKPFHRPGSKKTEGEYHVDLAEETCTCPHFCNRIAPAREEGMDLPDCKHLQLAREESYRIALDVARQLSPVNLRTQILRTDLRPEIHEALLSENWNRLNNSRPGSLPLAAVRSITARHAEDLTPA